jgi:hypothetical protein
MPRRAPRRRRPGRADAAQIDIGAQGATTARLPPGMELRAGIHWASLSPADNRHRRRLLAPSSWTPDDTMPTPTTTCSGGAYVEAGQTSRTATLAHLGLRSRRVLAAARSARKAPSASPAAQRAEHAASVGIEPRGLFLGNYAVGVYAESAPASSARLGAGRSAVLTFRTPLVLTVIRDAG